MDIHQGMAERFGREFTDADLRTINEASELASCVAYQNIDKTFDLDNFEFATVGGVMVVQVKTIFSLPYIVRVDRVRRMHVKNLFGVSTVGFTSTNISFPLLRCSIELRRIKSK